LGKESGKRAYIGIDVGGTKSLFALFDERFEVLAEEKFRTHPEKGGAGAFTEHLEKATKRLLKVAKKKGLTVKVTGVGCAGEIDMKQGAVRTSPNLQFLAGYSFRERLEKLTGGKVFLGNDVHCGLYGEYRLGAAKKARHVIGIWVGTGVGGAVIINGHLHLGTTGLAGNIGNYVLHAVDVASESVPRKEVLDSVASRTAIAGDAAALAARHHAPTLRKVAGTDVTDIKSGDLAHAIRKGDKAIERLVRSRAAVVGAALSNLVDFLSPDTIVLGGGLVEALPSLMKREIRKAIDAHAATKAAKAAKVVVAKLHDHAGTAGAACLALDMFSVDPPIDLESL
jgi:glucokinase